MLRISSLIPLLVLSLGSLALAGISVASGKCWVPSPRLFKGVLGLGTSGFVTARWVISAGNLAMMGIVVSPGFATGGGLGGVSMHAGTGGQV